MQPPLEPGSFQNPLVLLQRLQGAIGDHLHVDEVRYRAETKHLYQCSYTFGVVDASAPQAMKYLSEGLKHALPGDPRQPGCIHLAWDGNFVFTTHRGNIDNPAFLTAWDITNPKVPVQVPALQEPGVSYEGIDVANHTLFVALHDKGLGVYTRDASAPTNGFTKVATLGGFTNAWGVVARDTTVFVADAADGLVIVDAATPSAPKIVGKVATGGVARGVVVDGATAYVAAGSAVVVVDVANLAQPKVIGQVEMGDRTALRVDYAAKKLFVAAWNDARVYDVTAPAAPKLIGAVRLAGPVAGQPDEAPYSTWRTAGVAAVDDVMFVGNWHLIHSFRVHADRLAPNLDLPENTNPFDLGPVVVGSSKTAQIQVGNQGTAPLTLVNNWTEGTAFTVEPRQVAIPAGGKALLSVTYTPTVATAESSYLHLLSDDPAQPSRVAYLTGNRPGLGVGVALPETTVTLVDGTTQWSSTSAANKGSVTLIAYFATFCPSCTMELPDMNQRFWAKYQAKGLKVIAIDPGGKGGIQGMPSTDPLTGVAQFVANLGLSMPVGLEDTTNYVGFAANFKGPNPFPIDIVVGKDGKIAYVAREYDPGALTTVIESLLAQ
jgi:peroxiredoxin